jgi:hypothetical protein
MSGFERRSVAYRAPFKVVKIQNGAVFYNIVDKNGLGVASFGIDSNAAEVFCESANILSERILDEHRA